MSRPGDAALARALVGGQFLLLALWLASGRVLAHGSIGRGVQLAGLTLAVWAFVVMILAQRRMFNISPDPSGHDHLVRSGPYRWVRHPMYASILIVVAPPLVEWASGTAALLFAALAMVLVSKLQYEERLLRARFPGYEAYARESTRLIPFLY